MQVYGTRATSAGFTGFKPYRKKNVDKKEYTQLEIKGMGLVWAQLIGDITPEETEDEIKNVSVKYAVVLILGHGVPPFIDFWELPQEAQQQLVKHHLKLTDVRERSMST